MFRRHLTLDQIKRLREREARWDREREARALSDAIIILRAIAPAFDVESLVRLQTRMTHATHP